MDYNNLEYVFNRVRSKLGSPAVSFEIEEEGLRDLFKDAYNKYFLYKESSNRTEENLIRLKNEWVEAYFQANVKETIGNIRAKFSGALPIPGSNDPVKLEYQYLLDSSAKEKIKLENMLLNSDYSGETITASDEIVLIAVYMNVGNMDSEDVSVFCAKASSSLKEAFPSYMNFIVLPVRDQPTKIDLVYPNNFMSKEKIYNLAETMVDLDNRIKTIISDNEKQN